MMIWMVLVVFVGVNEAVIYKYTGDGPTLPMYYSKARDTRFTALLKIDAVEDFVLGRGCQDKGTCTTSNHRDIYDPKKYGGKKIGGWNTVIHDSGAVLCNVYETPLYTPIFDENSTSLFVAIKSVGKAVNLEQDGVLALNFFQTASNSFVLKKFYDSVEKKILIFRRGPFKQRLANTQINNTRGAFALGEESLNGCGNFEYTSTVPRSGWIIKTDVVVGDKKFPNQQVLFSIDRATQLPKEIFELFKDKAEQDLPELSFNFESQKFVLKKENLIQYKDGKANLDAEPTNRDILVLGKNFLKDYCISLKTSDELKFPQVGLAPVVPLGDDPQWEKV